MLDAKMKTPHDFHLLILVKLWYAVLLRARVPHRHHTMLAPPKIEGTRADDDSNSIFSWKRFLFACIIKLNIATDEHTQKKKNKCEGTNNENDIIVVCKNGLGLTAVWIRQLEIQYEINQRKRTT